MNFNTGESWESGSSVHSGCPLLHSPLCADTVWHWPAHLSETSLCWATASHHFQVCFSDKQYEPRTTFLHCLSIGHWNSLLIQLFLLKLAGDCQGVTLKTSHMSWETENLKNSVCVQHSSREGQRACGAVLSFQHVAGLRLRRKCLYPLKHFFSPRLGTVCLSQLPVKSTFSHCLSRCKMTGKDHRNS